jgi:galactokinase
VIEEFRSRFGTAGEVRVFRAPGRVNLIGEHTDYNLGFVLPIALDLATYVAAAPSGDGRVRPFSEDRNEQREWPAEQLATLPPAKDWSDYVLGVARELVRAGVQVEPQNLLIRSTVPEGSGLSSSAALEVSTALALLRGRDMDPRELAQLARRAEVEFVGMPCGIMDQYIAVFGQEHAAILIDCRSLESRAVRLPDNVEIVAVNSMVKHELGQSAYRERTQECAAAVELIRQAHPSVQSLRDVSIELFETVAPGLPELIRRRARHVVTENARVLDFIQASAEKDLSEMGGLFVESHRSLQHDYEVSCEELDYLVDRALEIPGVYGARMTGGGFGGCTVNLVTPGRVPQFAKEIREAYERRFTITPQVFVCRPSAGAGEVTGSSSIPPTSR